MNVLIDRKVILARVIAVTLCLAFIGSPYRGEYTLIVFALLIPHYIFAILQPLKGKASPLKGVKPWHGILLGLSLIGFTQFYLLPLSIALLHGLHHSLSESFFRTKTEQVEQGLSEKLTYLFRFTFHFLIYASLMTYNGYFKFGPENTLTYLSLAATLLYLVHLLVFDPKRLGLFLEDVPLILFQLLGFLFFSGKFFLRDHLFYHVLVWTIYPFTKIIETNKEQAKKLGWQLGLASLVAIGLSFTFLYGHYSRVKVAEQAVTLFGFVHIYQSLLISRVNPQFIVSLSNRLRSNAL